MDLTILKNAVNDGDFVLGLALVKNIPENIWNEEISILSASVYHAAGDLPHMFEAIRKGLLLNYKNYELYLLLGNYYEHFNADQAYLCYENALYYCEDPDDAEIIRHFQTNLADRFALDIRPVSIVMLTYNVKDLTIQSIESIRQTLPTGSYELICVDNASTDGIRDWLMGQDDIKLICNETNAGFPAACNAGIKISQPDNDILLLNNDTVLFPNSVFWLRMGLYSSKKTGAAGSVSNMDLNDQTCSGRESSINGYEAYAREHNVPEKYPYESKIYLIGFALLIRRHALDSIGLLDLRFSPGTFEDNDYGVRLQAAGFRCLLCHNSIIFHYGSGNGANHNDWCPVGFKNNDLFIEKHGYDLLHYVQPKAELISMIGHTPDDAFSVLEIGCGCGATLSKIKYLYPHATVHGMEIQPELACLGANNHDIFCGNIEEGRLAYPAGSFDYIILGNLLAHLHDPQKTLCYLSGFLKPSGNILCSIPNVMHFSVILPLLKGNFTYQEYGILNRSHIHFYTLDSILSLFCDCGLHIVKSYSASSAPTQEEAELLEKLPAVSAPADQKRFLAEKYLFSVEKAQT